MIALLDRRPPLAVSADGGMGPGARPAAGCRRDAPSRSPRASPTSSSTARATGSTSPRTAAASGACSPPSCPRSSRSPGFRSARRGERHLGSAGPVAARRRTVRRRLAVVARRRTSAMGLSRNRHDVGTKLARSGHEGRWAGHLRGATLLLPRGWVGARDGTGRRLPDPAVSAALMPPGQSRNSPRATTTVEPPTSTRSIRSGEPSTRAYSVAGRPISAPWAISISSPSRICPCR